MESELRKGRTIGQVGNVILGRKMLTADKELQKLYNLKLLKRQVFESFESFKRGSLEERVNSNSLLALGQTK